MRLDVSKIMAEFLGNIFFFSGKVSAPRYGLFKKSEFGCKEGEIVATLNMEIKTLGRVFADVCGFEGKRVHGHTFILLYLHVT